MFVFFLVVLLIVPPVYRGGFILLLLLMMTLLFMLASRKVCLVVVVVDDDIVVHPSIQGRSVDLPHNVCNLCAESFACAKFSVKRGKQSPRTYALKRRKPPLQPICQKQQKRTQKNAKK